MSMETISKSRMTHDDIICIAEMVYDNATSFKAVVVKCDFIPGSGDYADPNEIREDKYGDYYCVEFEDMTTPGKYISRRYYESLEDAKGYLESLVSFVRWIF